MLVMALLTAVELITLHMIDGRVVRVNPKEVVQLLSGPETGNKQLHGAVQCVVRFTDGSFTSVVENCETVRDMMGGK